MKTKCNVIIALMIIAIIMLGELRYEVKKINLNLDIIRKNIELKKLKNL